MEFVRAVDFFLKEVLPEDGGIPPFRLAVFDQGGELLHTVQGGEGRLRFGPGASGASGAADMPGMAGGERTHPRDWTFLPAPDDVFLTTGEDSGKTPQGGGWFRVAIPLPGKRAGSIAIAVPRPQAAAPVFSAFPAFPAFLGRALRQHFKSQLTLEETRIKAQFDERIIRSISSGFVVLLPDTRILHINPAGARILGGNIDDLIGRRLDTILTSKLRVKEVIETGKPIIDQEMMIQIGERSVHIVKTAVAVFDDDGQVVAVMDLFKEIREVHRLVNRMAGSQVRYSFDDILHRSPVMAETVEMGRTAAASSLSVLITGESGTGKELFAQAIHVASSRKNAPFVVIDCASMPRDLVEGELFGYMEGAFTGAAKGGRPGKFELADGGTVFLDELGELPLELQSRFLRVLQSRQVMRLGGSHPVPVDIRVIAATNRNLLEQIRTKSFRDDLYYRLNVLSIHIPPLRSRPEDILLLADHFLEKYQIKMQRQGLTFTREAVQALLRNPWPGNVRELENTVARAVQVCGGIVRPEDLSPEHYVPRGGIRESFTLGGERESEAGILLARRLGQDDGSAKSGGQPSGLAGLAGLSGLAGSAGAATPAPLEGLAGLRAAQVDFYLSTLRRFNGNIAEAARFLGVARSTVYKKMKALGLDNEALRAALK